MKFTPEETQYVKENRPLLRKSLQRFAYTNIKIKTKAAKVVRLRFNKLQRKLHQIAEQERKKGKPVRIYVVKSRQTGSSTYWLARYYQKCSMNSERNLLLIAHDDEGSEGLQSKFQNIWLRSHPLLKPKVRNMNRKETYFATPLSEYAKTEQVGLDCHIDSVSAAKKQIGRSYTYQYALITEFGLFEENNIDIKGMFGALFQAVPEEAGTEIVIETTAKGLGYAYEFWTDDANGFVKVFISWVADETYTMELDRNGEYFELSETEDSTFGNELEVYDQIEKEVLYWADNSNDLKEDIAELHHQVMCRLAWRRRTIQKKCLGDKQIFKNEYPLTAEDAFSTSAQNVFPSRFTDPMLKYAKALGSPKRFMYVHDKREDDKYKKFMTTLYGPMKAYRTPIADKYYVIGGDGAQGITGGDPSGLVVLELPEMVVAATYDEVISPLEFAGAAYWLSKIYNNALIGIELNDKGGYAAVQELEENYEDANLYFDDVKREHKGKLVRSGFVTNAITRSIMIADTTNYLTNGWLTCYDEEVIKQMRTFVKLPNGKLAALPGKKDDLIMSLMIALQIAKFVHIQPPKEPTVRPPRFSVEGLIRQMEEKQKGRGLRA